METTSVILDTLGLKTSDLERAQESFSGLWRKYDFRVKTFQEGLGLSGVHLGVLGNKVVSDTSSLLGDPRERAETIQANHMDMCRFTGAQDPNYRKIAGELRSIYQSVQKQLAENNVLQDKVILHQSLVSRFAPSSRNAREVIPNESEAILQKLRFPTMDLRYRSIPDPVEDTCYWFFFNRRVLDWLEGEKMNSHRGLLLLRGKPGAGKSVLMKEVYRRKSLEQAKSDCITAAFFFNAQGQELERSVVGMLRSLLYQILPMHREHLSLFESLWDSGNLQMPEQQLQALVKSLFRRPLKERTFIFIDALDECDSERVRDIAYFWREVTNDAYRSGAKLNVLMSTRDFPHFGLSNCPVIKVDDCNRLAIKSYIRQKTKLASIPEGVRYKFSETLAKKSRGVFLWVELAVKRMLEEWDEGQGPSALMDQRDCPPCGLEALFTDILKPTDGAMKQMTIRLFQWAALAIGPLRLHEWHHVLAFIRQPELQSLHDWRKSKYFTENDDQLEKQIRNLSRGLLEIRTVSTVDEGGSESMSIGAGAGSLDFSHGESRVVEFIHHSVQEFFLCGSGFSTLDDSLAGNHRAAGHLKIMETCLAYLDISELDALAEARSRLRQESADPEVVITHDDSLKDIHSQNVAYDAEGPTVHFSTSEPFDADETKDIRDGTQQVELIRKARRAEEPYQRTRARKRQKLTRRSLLTALNSLSAASNGIDIGQWVTSSQVQIRQGTSGESVRGSAISAGGVTQVLQDYPALLSYATNKLFSHAKRAQLCGANPKAIVRRLQEGSWVRWLLLKEVIAPKDGLHEIAKRHHLHSWYPYTAPDVKHSLVMGPERDFTKPQKITMDSVYRPGRAKSNVGSFCSAGSQKSDDPDDSSDGMVTDSDVSITIDDTNDIGVTYDIAEKYADEEGSADPQCQTLAQSKSKPLSTPEVRPNAVDGRVTTLSL
jgi:protein SERAC1